MLTKVADIPQNLLDIYSKLVIMESMPRMYFRQFVDYKLEFGLQPGERIKFPKLDNIAMGGKLLDEDTPIPEQKMTGSEIYATLEEFGNAITMSRRSATASMRNMLDDAKKLLVRDYSIVIDTYLRDVFLGTANKLYVAASYAEGANLAAVATPFDKNVLDMCIEKAKNLNMPKLVRGSDQYYAFIGTPHQIRQIRDTKGWMSARMYVNPSEMLNGEAGRIEDVVFFDTTQMPKLTGVGAGSVNVHKGLFIGGDAVGYGESIPLELIPGEQKDYGRKIGLAWYTIGGARILNDNMIEVNTAEGINSTMLGNIS